MQTVKHLFLIMKGKQHELQQAKKKKSWSSDDLLPALTVVRVYCEVKVCSFVCSFLSWSLLI